MRILLTVGLFVLIGGALFMTSKAQDQKQQQKGVTKGVVIDEVEDFKGVAFEQDKKNIENVLTGGVPAGRWKEGLLFEGVEPQPWLKSAANWFPGTEEVQPNEISNNFHGNRPYAQTGTDEYINICRAWKRQYIHIRYGRGRC